MNKKSQFGRFYLLVLLMGLCSASLALGKQTPIEKLPVTPSAVMADSSQLAVLPEVDETRISNAYGKLPLAFIRNDGQVEPSVRYYERGAGHVTYFTESGVTLVLTHQDAAEQKSTTKGATVTSAASPFTNQVVRLYPLGARTHPEFVSGEVLPTKVNYFIGRDKKKWHTDIPTYRAVHYQEIYSGIDLRFYGNNGQLEYDFIVAPGADPDKILMGYEGIEGLTISEDGDLHIAVEGGELLQKRPLIYQEIDGQRKTVEGHFVVHAKNAESPWSYGVEVAAYDKTRPLLIDPVMIYSTYLGGTLVDGVSSLAVDSNGAAYLTGSTLSIDFPITAGALQVNNNQGDAFVAKINPAGTALEYATFLGGFNYEVGTGIAVDSSGAAYVTGFTRASDFPSTVGALQEAIAGGLDVFVVKLNPTGTALDYATFLGGIIDDVGNGIAVDSSGAVYVTGRTNGNFPVTNGAFQPFPPTGTALADTFVAKINSAGTALVYSTYLGGSGTDIGNDIAIDSSGAVYVTGQTSSADFPVTTGAFQTTLQNNNSISLLDAFVTKINPAGTALEYSTYLGGTNADVGSGIAVDSSGAAYVIGDTQSFDFPTTPGAAYPFFAVGVDAFVAKLNPTGTALAYATYLGGSSGSVGVDGGAGIVVDSNGAAYVTGYTETTDFPTTADALQTGLSGTRDAYVTKINPDGTALVFSTYLGGTASEYGKAIAISGSGDIYVAGYTDSTDFPITAGAMQTVYGGGNQDVFFSKISLRTGSTTPSSQGPIFPGEQFNAGASPSSVATGDVDGDGFLDLALANSGSDDVSVLLGNGDGTFQAAVSYAVGTNPQAVEIGDVNGDGSLDLAVANAASNNVSVLLGNGDGTFQVAQNYFVGTNPISVATGDVNGDGSLDLAVANAASNNVSVLLGNGDGTFQVAVNYAAGAVPQFVASGDINGDGAIDLAVANSSGVGILLGNSDGTFQAVVSYTAGTTPRSVATADVNGDGVLDLAVANHNSNNVSVLLGNGDGTFQAAANYSVGANPISVSSGDVNGDGRLDLAVANLHSYRVSVLLGNGDGTFQPAVHYIVGENPRFIVAADVNGDGALDIAVLVTNAVGILLGNGDGTFRVAIHYATGARPFSIAPGDVNGDGVLDLAVASFGSGNASVLIGNGDGTFRAATNYVVGTNPYSIVTGDINGDDALDLAVANRASNNISVLLGNGDGSFQAAINYNTGSGPQSVASGDVNGDGVLDLVVANLISSNISVLLGNGDGSFQAAVNYGAGLNPYSIACGDVNGDGILDLAVANFNSHNVSVLLGNGDGTFQIAIHYATGERPSSVATGDVNGDGVLDLAVASFGSDNVSVLLGNGDGSFQAAVNYAAGSFPLSVAIGDVNADGILDLAVANSNSANVSLLLGNGDGTFQVAVNYIAGISPSSLTAADINGDGALDLAVTNDSFNDVGILLNQLGIPSNNHPIAAMDNFATAMDVSLTTGNVLVNDSDPDGDAFTLTSADTVSSQGGTVLNYGDGTFFYTPPVGFQGVDTFQYTITDSLGASATGTVRITVTAINQPPTISTIPDQTVSEGSAVTVNVSASDTDIVDTLTLSMVDASGLGVLTDSGNGNGSITFTAPANSAGGPYGVIVTVTDADGATASTSFNLTVTAAGTTPGSGVDAPDLSLASSNLVFSPSIPNAGESVTLTATIRNIGTASSSSTTVQFYDMDVLLGEVALGSIVPGGTGVTALPVSFPTEGARLIRAVVDPNSLISELDENNNEVSRLLQVGTSSTASGHIIVTGSLPSTVTSGQSFTVSGNAAYEIIVNNVALLNNVVKGGLVQITIRENIPNGQEWVYAGVHTDANGVYSQVLQAPTGLGEYKLIVSVTDGTSTGSQEAVFNVVDQSTSPPPPPSGSGSGTGSWTFSGGSGGSTGTWTWGWTVQPAVDPNNDAYLVSDDIAFSNNNPAVGEEINIFANIHFWSTDSSVVAENIPINIYVTAPGLPKTLISTQTIDRLSIGSPDYGSRIVFTSWQNTMGGIFTVEVEIDPSFVDTNLLNNAATRSIIVGDLVDGVVEGHVTSLSGGVQGVTIELLDLASTVLRTTTTDRTGAYLLPGLTLGQRQVRITPPAGHSADSSIKPADVIAGQITTVDFSLTQQSAPVAVSDDFTTTVDTPLTTGNVLTNDSDPDGDAFTLTRAESMSTKGGTIVNYGDGTFLYTPPTGFEGVDTFQYTITDSLGASSAGTVQITVILVAWEITPVNQHNFGLEFVNQSANSPYEATLTNTGSSAITVGQVTSNSPEFQISYNDCTGVAIIPGAVCNLEIRFKPTSVGMFSGAIDIEINGTLHMGVIAPLEGEGVDPGAPILSNAVLNTPNPLVYSGFACPPESVKNLVVITHGWRADSTTWVTALANEFARRLGMSTASNEWAVYKVDWKELADTPLLDPSLSYVNARAVGEAVGKTILSCRGSNNLFENIHFIAHSSGSNLINEAAKFIRGGWGPNVFIHSTFLDAYDPEGGKSNYGEASNWAEQYVDTRGGIDGAALLIGDTNIDFKTAFNFHVTRLDPDYAINTDFNQFGQPITVEDPVSYTLRVHALPYKWYLCSALHPKACQNPTTRDEILPAFGANQSLEYHTSDVQFRLPGFNDLKPGYRCDLSKPELVDINSCSANQEPGNLLKYERVVKAFDKITFINPSKWLVSGTGLFKLLDPTSFTLTTRSPVWVSKYIDVPEKANMLQFDYEFLSTSDGLLQVVMDDRVIYKQSETVANAGMNETGPILIGDIPPGPHTLSFRLDKFGTVQSMVKVSDIRLGTVELVDVSDDTGPPTIFAIKSPPANAAGWNNGDVTVSFSCSDAEYGIRNCTSPVLVTTEGSGQQVTGVAEDLAGNTASTSSTVNLDKTPPSLTCPASTAIDATTPAGIPASASSVVNYIGGAPANDALSGLATLVNSLPRVLPIGATSVTFTATDVAGNSTSCQSGIKVTNPAPVVMAIAPQIVDEGQSLNLSIAANDPNGESLLFSATDLPAGASIDPTSGVVSYTPGFDVSSYLSDAVFNATINVNDGTNTTATPLQITVHNVNRLPVANAGADQHLECLWMSCPVTLDGTASSDPDSTPGTRDDIHTYEWYEGSALIGTGVSPSISLALGTHTIRLVATDFSGAAANDEVMVTIDPVPLSVMDLDKAEVEWAKGKVKLYGRIALPAGRSYMDVNPEATVNLVVSELSILPLVDEAVNFTVNGGKEWTYKGNESALGIHKFNIGWKGDRFDYDQAVRIKSEHLGVSDTTLEIDPKNITGAWSLSVNGITVDVADDGTVNASDPTVRVDVDDDGEIEVDLPFALSPDMTLTLSGAVAATVSVGDYYTPAAGRFQIKAAFNAGAFDPATLSSDLTLILTLGTEHFPGSYSVSPADWKELKATEWKYKATQ